MRVPVPRFPSTPSVADEAANDADVSAPLEATWRTVGGFVEFSENAQPYTRLVTLATTPVRSRVFAVTAPALALVDAIKGAVLATSPLVIAGPFNQPDVPRTLQYVFDALWDGGTIYVTGTDVLDRPITEMVPSNPGATSYGTVAFKTITGITHSLIGVQAVNVTIGTWNGLGVPVQLVDTAAILLVNSIPEAVTVDITTITYGLATNIFTPTTPPDGVASYAFIGNV